MAVHVASQSSLPPSGWKDGDTLCEPLSFVDHDDPDDRNDFAHPPGLVCILQPSEETPIGGHSAEAQDTTVCRAAETKNAFALAHLNTSVPPGATEPDCLVVLRFAIREEIPRNLTVVNATLTLFLDPAFYTSAQNKATLSRQLTARNILTPWDEDTATWHNFPQTAYNWSVEPVSRFDGAQSLPSQNAFSTFGGFPMAVTFFVTESVEQALRGVHSHSNGWVIKDEGSGACAQAVPCKWSFYSSASRDDEGRPRATCGVNTNAHSAGDYRNYEVPNYCWPILRVELHQNPAVPHHLKFHYNTTRKAQVYDHNRSFDLPYHVPGKVPWNLSVEGTDSRGRIDRATYEIRNESGVLFLREDFAKRAYNRTFDVKKSYGERSWFWTTRSFDLPDGKYYVNVTMRDVDGHHDWLNMTDKRPVLFVDAQPPRMKVVKFPETVAQGASANITMNFTDPRGIDAAFVEVRAPSGYLEVLKLKPAEYDWSNNRTWFEPGVHSVRIRVNDTLGNTNTTTRSFRVVDVKLPVPCAGEATRFDAPALRFGERVQEEGGPVWVEACVQDETPVNVTVRLTHTSGEVREYPMPRVGPDRYNTSFAAPQEGRHDVRIVAEDRDGNEAELGRYTLAVEPARPPAISGFVPAAGGWANATPAMSATFADLNLDRATIRMDVREGDEPFERATPLIHGIPKEIVGTIVGRTYDHLDAVDVRASANDSLGHASPPAEWSFRVDTAPPRLNVTLVGDRSPGAVASFVTREARLDAVASDGESGLDRIEAKWTNPDRKLETPWTPVTGNLRLVDPQVDRGAGLYEVRVRSVDRVGNVGVVPEVRFVLDPDPPNATVSVAGDALHVDLVDAGAGLQGLVVGARLLGDPSFAVHDLAEETRRQPQGGRFTVPIPVVSKGETLEYYVLATDLLGNRLALGSALEPQRYTGINHAPRLAADAPENDTEVRGVVDLSWTASDDDLDPVRVDLEVRPVVLEEGELLAQRASPRGAAAWDTRTTPDGVWIVTFTARDQEAATVVERRVLVNNTGTGLGAVVAPAGRVEYLDEVRFEVTLYRPVVEARLLVHDDKGRRVAEHELHDDGARGDRVAGDGVYTALYQAAEKGEYRTDVEVVYADAGTVVMKGAGVYTVRSSFGAAFERNLVWVLLGGVVLVALGAFVVVQLMRYGYL